MNAVLGERKFIQPNFVYLLPKMQISSNFPPRKMQSNFVSKSIKLPAEKWIFWTNYPPTNDFFPPKLCVQEWNIFSTEKKMQFSSLFQAPQRKIVQLLPFDSPTDAFDQPKTDLNC